jgi:hypothetical protein
MPQHQKYSLDFGKKEKVLNYATQTYQLSRPNKVGAVMALIRECQPATIAEWEKWYFENAFTEAKMKTKITKESLTINRTFDGFLREKSVVNDGLAKIFSTITFEESDPELDHAGDIDYIAKVGSKAFGIQIKPVTAKANFGNFRANESKTELVQVLPSAAENHASNYSAIERMKASFADFEDKFGGQVFVVFSLDGEIANKEVIEDIRKEIERLSNNE